MENEDKRERKKKQRSQGDEGKVKKRGKGKCYINKHEYMLEKQKFKLVFI